MYDVCGVCASGDVCVCGVLRNAFTDKFTSPHRPQTLGTVLFKYLQIHNHKCPRIVALVNERTPHWTHFPCHLSFSHHRRPRGILQAQSGTHSEREAKLLNIEQPSEHAMGAYGSETQLTAVQQTEQAHFNSGCVSRTSLDICMGYMCRTVPVMCLI